LHYNSRVKSLLPVVLFFSIFSFAQWTKLDSGTDASLRGVSAVDANICWVTGSKGTVLRTTGGGAHWTKLPVPNADKLDFRDVEAFDANTAVIMSAGPAEQGAGEIFKTTDAGVHWKEVLTTDHKGVFFDSMAFWDKKRGILFSDPVDGHFVLWTTDDGGDSWKELHPESMPAALANEGAFAASGTAIAVAGKNDVWFGTGGAAVARVFHSSDHGKHWTAVKVPIAAGTASAGVFGVAFKDSKHGVAVGGDYTNNKDKLTAIATTQDGGKTWSAVEAKFVSLGGVVTVYGEYYAVGNTSLVVGSGNRWSNEDARGLEKWKRGQEVFLSGYSVASKRTRPGWPDVFVVGPKGEVWRFTGGTSINARE
jgi:photosystem II stability/assembly factor-like uncharacterized protein